MLELRGKLDLSDESNEDPTFQALVALGYTQAQAASAVTALPASLTGEQERIKEALKGLSK
jgi:Holliday junction resolvasome RuvABC DNA-binding subunit